MKIVPCQILCLSLCFTKTLGPFFFLLFRYQFYDWNIFLVDVDNLTLFTNENGGPCLDHTVKAVSVKRCVKILQV